MLAGLDWSTVATLATAVGTLVLAIATFAAVRSANRAARISEAAYRANLRPVLVTSRLDDPVQKIRWMDNHWARVEGSQASVEVTDENIYLAASLRNVGSGLAVPMGWSVMEGAQNSTVPHRDPEQFRMQTRDLLVAAGDVGFWQAAIRDHGDPDFKWLCRVVSEVQTFTLDLLYGDNEGGQRTITRFGMIPLQVDGNTRWYPSTARHWNLDRPDPR
ncbi:MAG TPA: hypothetical protein VG346_05045 [Acidimicrobiales bacterium]|nr:hypothetical protein [Acidimicrobiales bacterium]